MTFGNYTISYPSTMNGGGYGYYERKQWGGGDGWGNQNPYILTSFKKYNDVLVNVKQGIIPWTQRGSGAFGAPNFSIPDYSSKVLNKLYSNMKEHDLNLGVSLAESRESLKMLADMLRSLGRSLKAARSGNFPLAVSILASGSSTKIARIPTVKDLSQQWLRYYYGISPFLSDIYEAVKAYDNRYRIVRSRQIARMSADGKLLNNLSQHQWKLGEAKRRYQIIAYLSSGYGLTTSQYLGLENPAYILWEKVPASFIIDWVLPVGDWLQAVHAVQAIQTDLAVMTTSTYIRYSNLVGKNSTQILNGEGANRIELAMNRVVNVSLSPPVIPFKTLSQSLGRVGVNVWNAVALVTSRR